MVVTARLLIDQSSVYDVVDSIHKTFARRLLEAGQAHTPVDTGAMRDSWESQREDVHTTHVGIPNDNTGAEWDLPGVGKVDWLIRGTGEWGPLNRPYCGKHIYPVEDWRDPIRIKPMVWRDKHTGILIRKECVKGINPRAIHGQGHTYDFEADLKRAFNEGVENAVKEMNE